jgi:hypothetical protein
LTLIDFLQEELVIPSTVTIVLNGGLLLQTSVPNRQSGNGKYGTDQYKGEGDKYNQEWTNKAAIKYESTDKAVMANMTPMNKKGRQTNTTGKLTNEAAIR